MSQFQKLTEKAKLGSVEHRGRRYAASRCQAESAAVSQVIDFPEASSTVLFAAGSLKPDHLAPSVKLQRSHINSPFLDQEHKQWQR